ncbi:hypothetical protein Bbelb_358910 [Branchiostoma belcheri]|nr:hypothetical protein Bbelb_358910 [Branchiostoma belcheri]
MPDGSGRAGSDGVPSLISGTAVRGKFVDAANCVGTVRTPFPTKDGQGRRPMIVDLCTTVIMLQITLPRSPVVTRKAGSEQNIVVRGCVNHDMISSVVGLTRGKVILIHHVTIFDVMTSPQDLTNHRPE